MLFRIVLLIVSPFLIPASTPSKSLRMKVVGFPDAEVLPAEISDGSDFAKRYSDQSTFKAKQSEVFYTGSWQSATNDIRDLGFSRKTTDGLTLQLEKEVPTAEEFDVATARYRLVKRTPKGTQVVWSAERFVSRHVFDNSAPPFALWDAVEINGKTYVFYSLNTYAYVDIMEKGRWATWTKFASIKLTDDLRLVGIGAFYRDQASGSLGFIYKDSSDTEERWIGFDKLRAVKSVRPRTGREASREPHENIESAVASLSQNLLTSDPPDAAAVSSQLAHHVFFSKVVGELKARGTPAKGAMSSMDVLLSRKCPDGATLKIERRLAGASRMLVDGVPRDFARVTYQLVIVNGETKEQMEMITEDYDTEALPFLGEDIVFWDAIATNDQMLVLFSDHEDPQIEICEKVTIYKGWDRVLSISLSGLGHKEAVARFCRDAKTGQIVGLYKDSPDREICWTGFDQIRKIDLAKALKPAPAAKLK
jgi:hypothetical protein